MKYFLKFLLNNKVAIGNVVILSIIIYNEFWFIDVQDVRHFCVWHKMSLLGNPKYPENCWS